MPSYHKNMWADDVALSTRTDINKVRLAHHISLASMVTYPFYCIFRNSA